MAFKKGQSGNPSGKPKGTKSKRTMIKEALVSNSFLVGFAGEIDSLINLIIKADATTSHQAEVALIERLRGFRRG